MRIQNLSSAYDIIEKARNNGMNLSYGDAYLLEERFINKHKRMKERLLRPYRKYLERVPLKPIYKLVNVPIGYHLHMVDWKIYMFPDAMKGDMAPASSRVTDKRMQLENKRQSAAAHIVGYHFQNPRKWVDKYQTALKFETPTLSIHENNERYIDLKVPPGWAELNKQATDRYLISRKIMQVQEGEITIWKVKVWDKVEIRKKRGPATEHNAFLAYTPYAHTISLTEAGARNGVMTKQFNKVRGSLS